MSLVPISTYNKYQTCISPPRQKQLSLLKPFSIFQDSNNSQFPNTTLPWLFLPYRSWNPSSSFCSLQHPPSHRISTVSQSSTGLPVSHPKPVFLRPISLSAPQSPTGTGNKVFVNRSLSSQNMCARASKWLEKNLHLLEIRLRLLSFKR